MRTYDNKYLKKASDDDVRYVFDRKSVLERNKSLIRNHWEANKGMTKDKSMKFVGSFHVGVLFHPEMKKYFDPRMDKHEAKKHIYRFLQKHPEYKVS